MSELEAEAPEQPRPASDSTPPMDDQPSPFAPRPRQRRALISPAKLALVGAVAGLAGLLFPVLKWLSLVGLAVMAAAIAWMFFRRMGNRPQQYWRGRPVEPEPQGAWQRFRRWLAR